MRLVGGADLNAANPLAVQPSTALQTTGNVVLVNNGGTQVGKVRTGTGNIDVAAGRDIVIQDPPGATPTTAGDKIMTASAAVFYTAGLPGVDGGATSFYPTGGGNISLNAQGNITGAAKQQQYVNDWLRRATARATTLQGQASGWWAARDTFRDNVGTLGGGDIRIAAGGNVTNLSLALPSSGRVFTDASGQRAIDVQGGGALELTAGGNLDGGEILIGRGAASMRAQGNVGQTNALALYLMGQSSDPALDGASFSVVSGGDLHVQNISNPTMLASGTIPGRTGQGFDKNRAVFFTYSPAASAELTSLTGNVTIDGTQRVLLSKQAFSPNIDSSWSDILPPHFSAIALQGSITGNHAQPDDAPLRLYPTANSSLLLYAGQSVTNVAFAAEDLNPASQPFWGWNSVFGIVLENVPFSNVIPFGPDAVNRIVTPNPSGRYDFVVNSGSGNIADSTFFLTREAWIAAGTDLRDVRLDLQNLLDSDISVVKAGRDIKYVPQYSSGILDRTNKGGYIRIGGPGRLLVQAGRNLDLGTTEGITAGGNNFNSNLPSSQSAALTIMAGVTGDISTGAIDQLFSDLKIAGLAQNAALGEVAIGRVFNGSNTGPGSITMFFSSIKTQGGSGIDLLVPAGDINAGLPIPGGGNIGVFTTFGGGIRTYLSGNFNVNQSKVATLDGGNILIYSSNGNIDAGRGARDSLTTQPPQRVAILDSNGNPTGLFTFIPPSDASGSGIRSLTFDPDGPGPLTAPKPGDIFLFAPKGFIDAGEAGVSSAGNIFVAALQVLNANNFSAAGSSVGVPVAVNTGISTAAAGAGSVGASAAKSADDVTKSLAASAAATTPNEVIRPSIITVELLGVGDEKSGDDAKERKNK
jgi:hypothetical protein